MVAEGVAACRCRPAAASFFSHLPASLGFSPSPPPWREVAQKPLQGRCPGGGGVRGAGVTGEEGTDGRYTMPFSLPSRYARPSGSLGSSVKIHKIPASDLKNFFALVGT